MNGSATENDQQAVRDNLAMAVMQLFSASIKTKAEAVKIVDFAHAAFEQGVEAGKAGREPSLDWCSGLAACLRASTPNEVEMVLGLAARAPLGHADFDAETVGDAIKHVRWLIAGFVTLAQLAAGVSRLPAKLKEKQ